ncbi:hypothetical protein Sros_9345 [Streptosporangium roseum DSM 43021]|uniref:Uncharacterized protein n=1 Tax=Streptosporangium roseum (strain ATCC 12428 / DSM 43021 / JCM 3005 / KCTC 9067 / NCIMB 10171 / NRRL 2505 / NI 9100) TaxID=479432 RepID=D2BEC6_STRRD|nr:hypothetical protein Sros_9345 [Streptosporangium roseum DSM 43021]
MRFAVESARGGMRFAVRKRRNRLWQRTTRGYSQPRSNT